jgi:uncharacterized protein
MKDEVLEAYVKGYIEAQPGPHVSFAWQGGEPTLAGLAFFRKVIELQKRFGQGRQIENAFQTNGTTLNDEWCEFLAANGFLVGISIDGPEALHDAYRTDRNGKPTYRKVVRGIELCKKHGVEFNTLTVVNRKNVEKPLEVYRLLREIGSQYIQFIPLVERKADEASNRLGLGLAHPPDAKSLTIEKVEPQVTEWSVSPKALGDFYCKIFDRWVTRDVGKVFVQLFDVTLGKWVGSPGGVCMYAETCGRAMAMEHNGDVYACDHYVYPGYKVGNVMEQSLAEMADSQQMSNFGRAKLDGLTQECLDCPVRFCCNGDCPKHRFAWTKDGQYGLSYLCEGLKRFFTHSAPAMRTMAELYSQRRSPAEIMTMKR